MAFEVIRTLPNFICLCKKARICTLKFINHLHVITKEKHLHFGIHALYAVSDKSKVKQGTILNFIQNHQIKDWDFN
jgi:hypothetical protein